MLCLLALVLAGAVFLITAPSMADSTRVADYGGAELSPLTEAYQLWGWNVPRYYYYLFVHLFAGYPWVVRVAYMVIIFCCIAFSVLMCVMVADFYLRRRNKKKLEEIRKKYLEKLKGVCYAEVENLPTEEISRRLDYKHRKWKDWEMRQWAAVFIEASTFTNTQNPNLTNIQRAMRLVGFTDYVERQLLHGKQSVKLQMIHTVRLTNMQLPTLYANGGQYVAGYFVSSYETAESSISDSAVDLGGTQRQISDAAWKNFTTLDANTEGGLGALLVDYSGIAQITDVRAADLEAADIPMIIYSSADATSEITTVLTLGFLFGGDCEEIGVEYAQKSWDVINLIEEKVGSLSNDEKCSYICCTMYIYICENDSTFNSSASTAGGLPYYIVNSDFSETYAGDGSTKMQSVEALSNYTDVGAILNNRSMDWGLDQSEMESTVLNCWENERNGHPVY